MKIVVIVVSAFVLGILTSVLFTGMPDGEEQISGNMVVEKAESPSDKLTLDNIQMHNDKVILDVKNAELSSFAYTGSMEPVFGSDSNGLEIRPESTSSIEVGDIISYYFGSRLYVHRVIGTGVDGNGWFARVKGDNLEEADGVKVRFDDISGVVIGVIY